MGKPLLAQGGAMKEKAVYNLVKGFLHDTLPQEEGEERIPFPSPQLGLQHALRDLVRLAVLPLQAQALFGWAGEKGVPRFLEDGLPKGIRDLLKERGALPTLKGGKEVWADLREVPALSFPWAFHRMGDALCIGRWRYDPDNHRATLYRPIGVLIFYNGLHSGSVGILRREGLLPATEADMALAYRAGLRVVWKEDTPVAQLDGKEEAFAHPGYGLLWSLGQLLWEAGIRL